ncbi:glycerol-3-phosphate acyltransferase [Anthocerotibacter panamensis]|uniref:glycerol-3-phosphate acyltransferase n=1 Tax=Anthocerotibacter panamensis TaxID=2857077 RepID=UPI001C408AD2|nr:glycerol-3-phosphate acyltransferase [Anthocerotibacter panamensis]
MGVLLIVFALVLGALPLTDWIFRAVEGKALKSLGTGNVGVTAAFQQGGKRAGIPAVIAEAGRGIMAVLAADALFPTQPAWAFWSLVALVLGRFLATRGAGVTNVLWGIALFPPLLITGVLATGGVLYLGTRNPRLSRRVGIGSLPLWVLVQTGVWDGALLTATVTLVGILIGIDWVLKDDWEAHTYPRLGQKLAVHTVGAKAANLSLLQQKGFPVPEGWVLDPTQDLRAFARIFPLERNQPVIVRSSALGEDSLSASAAGQYLSLPNIQDREALTAALERCRASYQTPQALQYRARTGSSHAPGMPLLIQRQIQGKVSGVLFTRSPLDARHLVIEYLPGGAERVVSGQYTPQQLLLDREHLEDALTQPCDLPAAVLQKLVGLALDLEGVFQDTPQDIEWTWDGSQIWILQSRPITTLTPIWTRTIAAEVIPGLVRPLTWSINQPMTCGVWGELFSVILEDTQGLDFTQTATLHQGRAYFNATLLGEIFRRMGLPEEGLEFLVRGKKFRRPPLSRVLKNLPGLLRLMKKERQLIKTFDREEQERFAPLLTQIYRRDLDRLTLPELWATIQALRGLLTRATYFNILAPLGLAVRQALFKTPEGWLNFQAAPEIQAISRLKDLAQQARAHLDQPFPTDSATLQQALQASSRGREIWAGVAQVVVDYGFLSEASTDIASITWQEAPETVHQLFFALIRTTPRLSAKSAPSNFFKRWTTGLVQRRADLKGRVAGRYGELIARLRWTFLALEKQWLRAGVLAEPGDIFYLTYAEIEELCGSDCAISLLKQVADRKAALATQRDLAAPPVVYGKVLGVPTPYTPSGQILKGIPASRGQVEGLVQVLTALNGIPLIQGAILVVPFTDAAWAAVLLQARGIIAEVGGQLSHGAVIAREYGIPAVMNVEHALSALRDGQYVRLDGTRGTVELLPDPSGAQHPRD